jgi:hypothetical protein
MHTIFWLENLKRLPGQPRRRWEYNNRMHLGEVGWERVGWMHLAQDGNKLLVLVNRVMNFPVQHKAEKFLSS